MHADTVITEKDLIETVHKVIDLGSENVSQLIQPHVTDLNQIIIYTIMFIPIARKYNIKDETERMGCENAF